MTNQTQAEAKSFRAGEHALKTVIRRKVQAVRVHDETIGCVVLTRRIGEWVEITTTDGVIRIQMRAGRSNAERRLAIVAPKAVKVLREELKERD